MQPAGACRWCDEETRHAPAELARMRAGGDLVALLGGQP